MHWIVSSYSVLVLFHNVIIPHAVKWWQLSCIKYWGFYRIGCNAKLQSSLYLGQLAADAIRRYQCCATRGDVQIYSSRILWPQHECALLVNKYEIEQLHSMYVWLIIQIKCMRCLCNIQYGTGCTCQQSLFLCISPWSAFLIYPPLSADYSIK